MLAEARVVFAEFQKELQKYIAVKSDLDLTIT